MMEPNIYQYIKAEENNYEADEIRLGDNWMWNMRDHIQMIYHLKNSIFYTGENDWLRSFKNIMEPVLNLSFWSEDIELKDVVFYVTNDNNRALSFILKKYHDEVYVRENDLDTFFDEMTESDLEYGGALVQKTKSARPEVIDMTSIAFCDQTDILGGPIAIKHNFAPEKLRQKSKIGWGDEKNGANTSIEDLIMLAGTNKDAPGDSDGRPNEVPGKNIEVYIVRGSLPEHYLKDNDNFEDHYPQLHVVAFYTDKKGKKQGVTLYRKKNEQEQLKFHTSKKVDGRALGRGVGESLLHPQIWTNFLSIHKTKMLEAASKVLLYTDDDSFTQRNSTTDMDNLEVATVNDGNRIDQIPTAAPVNVQLFDNSINEWFEHAQLTGSAFDPLLGKQSPSGTTFKGQERVVQQGRGLHQRRRGQRAKFIEQIYRDWIIPKMKQEILDEKQFIATFTASEMRWLTKQVATSRANKKIVDKILDGETVTKQQAQEIRDKKIREFSSGGNKRMIKILEDEMRDIDIKVGINIANKQKNLADLSDKVLSIFQQVLQNPQTFKQAMQEPALAESFEDILEYGGLSQADFSSLMDAPEQPLQLPQQMQATQTQRMQPNQPQV